MNTYNLFITLIFLTCLLLVLVSGYILNHRCRRNRKPQTDVENDPVPHQQSRPETLREHYDEEQRLSHLTTVAPSIELLPEIRTSTSSDRAEDWLELRDSQVMDGDLGLKTFTILGTNDTEVLRWDWRDGKKDVAESSDEEKEQKVERRSFEDKVVLGKE